MMFFATCVMLSLTYLVCVLQLQVLKTWVELTGNIERGTKVGWSRLFQWLDKFAQEDFWLGDRGKCITQVLQQMRAKALYANYVSVHICGVYHIAENFRGRKLSREFCGFVAIHESFLCKIWGHGVLWRGRSE